jgi:hypothetical protein
MDAELRRSFLELDREIESEDAEYFLESHLLEAQIKQLLHYKVKPGDGDLPTIAKWVLETGVKHIEQGRPTDAFLKFLAQSIRRTLSGEEKDIESALRLKQPEGRPQKDPYQDKAIQAYLDYINANMDAAESLDDSSKERAKKVNAVLSKAIEQAYEARWGGSSQSHHEADISRETIKDRKKSIKQALASLGHYPMGGVK